MQPINLSIEFNGEWNSTESVQLQMAYKHSIQNDTKLSNNILTMEGMSGHRYRRLINKLVEITPDARYLEIGSWAGSTACSAIYNNKCKITCIDNWSLFDGPKDTFFQNINTFKNNDINFHFIEDDYNNIDYSQIGKFNIYLFDGPHEEHQQYAGIKLSQEALDDTYFLIVDDWNWPWVRNGTLNALSEIGSTILSSIIIRTTQNNEHPSICQAESEWHNGYFIAVIKK